MGLEVWKILVPVLLFGAGIVWAVTWWLVRRMIEGYSQRLAVAETGMRSLAADLQTRPTRQDVMTEVTALREVITGFREDTERREDRVLSALRDHGAQVRQDIGDLRTEVRTVHGRVDQLIQRTRS